MVTAKGFSGTLAGPNIAGAKVLASYFQMLIAGSLNWSVSRPKPGMFAVQPQPQGLKSTSVTLMASPGSAPSMAIGPKTGLTREKSRLGMSFAVQLGVIWPAEE